MPIQQTNTMTTEGFKNEAVIAEIGLLEKRDPFWFRLVIASVLAGPLNPVGLLVAGFFLRGGWEAAIWPMVIVNTYCTIATLIGAMTVTFSEKAWTSRRLIYLGLSTMTCLYGFTCFLGLLTGPAVLLFIVFGLFLAVVVGTPASLIGSTIFELIVFKRSGART